MNEIEHDCVNLRIYLPRSLGASGPCRLQHLGDELVSKPFELHRQLKVVLVSVQLYVVLVSVLATLVIASVLATLVFASVLATLVIASVLAT